MYFNGLMCKGWWWREFDGKAAVTFTSVSIIIDDTSISPVC